MKRIVPGEIPTADLHQYILGSVSPRPIAFVSTVNAKGEVNLAPYSFFNAFSSNPPMLIFSSNRRVSGNTTKDTLHNIEETKECVINIVNYSMVRQMAIASVEYPSDVNEFEKAGLTAIPSEKVKAPRVKESYMQFECKVREVISLGLEGGAGNLVLCEPVLIHLSEDIFDENGKMDPRRTDHVARLGRAYYARITPEVIFPVFQPVNKMAIGFEALPAEVRNSKVLSGNDLGILAGVEKLPDASEIKELLKETSNLGSTEQRHQKAKQLIEKNLLMEAWAVLLA